MNPDCTKRYKTITVNLADAQPGDTFTGTIDTSGVTLTVEGPLRLASGKSSQLYVLYALPCIDVLDRWRNVTITRRVEEKSPYLHFEVGTLVRHTATKTTYFKTKTGWVSSYNDGDEPFDPGLIRSTIENRGTFEDSYELLFGPEPTPDWS